MKVIVVGAGPCGILASYQIKLLHPEYQVTLIDKDNQIAKRIKVSGNGRCNFSNANITIDKYKHGNEIKHILDSFNLYQNEFYKNINLHYYQDECGRMYPVTNSSKTVQTLMLNALNKVGVKINLNEVLVNIKYQEKIEVQTSLNKYTCDKLVLAIGGISYLNDKDSHNVLSSLKINETKMYPSLCPIKVKEKLTKDIVGKRSKARVSLLKDNKIVFEEDGELLFKKDGLSGIVVFNVASYIANNPSNQYVVKVTLFPELNKDDIELQLKHFSKLDVLKSYVVDEIAYYLDTLNKSVYEVLTDLRYHVASLYDFKESQVTSGGIDIEEIDLNTLSLKRYPNIYVGGELIDVDGKCGGFNIHFAMASGYFIGINC